MGTAFLRPFLRLWLTMSPTDRSRALQMMLNLSVCRITGSSYANYIIRLASNIRGAGLLNRLTTEVTRHGMRFLQSKWLCSYLGTEARRFLSFVHLGICTAKNDSRGYEISVQRPD